MLIRSQMALPEKAVVEQTDYKPLENIVSSIVKEKQVFQRLTLSKEDL
jgi:threonyl-tRNA synthetase